MATLPQFAQRKLARKTSDITRLTDSYKSNVDALTDQYQSSFADYQKKRDAIMAPYNAAVDKYKTDYSTYESAAADYKNKLAAYQANLADVQANPLEEIAANKYSVTRLIRYGTSVNIDGKSYSVGDGSQASSLPDGYTFENNKLYKARTIGSFTDKAPTAPEAPKQPTVDAFDTTQFDSQRASLDSSLQRDLGERKAAKVAAASRKSARPLLQGV